MIRLRLHPQNMDTSPLSGKRWPNPLLNQQADQNPRDQSCHPLNLGVCFTQNIKFLVISPNPVPLFTSPLFIPLVGAHTFEGVVYV